MRNVVITFAALVTVTGAAGCAYPTKTSVQGSTGSSVTFAGFNPEANIFVDGVSVGVVERFDGSKGALALPSGAHEIEVRGSAGIIHSETIYLDGKNSAVIRITN